MNTTVQPQLKLLDLVEFVWKNRGTKSFKEYQHKIQIAIEIARAINDNSILYSYDTSGNINGMILAEKNIEKKILFITENLSMSLANLRMFGKKCRQMYPDYKLQWCKNGKKKHHDTDKVYSKLS